LNTNAETGLPGKSPRATTLGLEAFQVPLLGM
jgi:hypothetical protein